MTNWLKQAIGLDDKETVENRDTHMVLNGRVINYQKNEYSESSDLLDVHATFKKYHQIQGVRVSLGRKAKQSQTDCLHGSSETD